MTPLPIQSCQSDEMFRGWADRWRSTPDHLLTLRDYVGPFPVGPEGYRTDEIAMLEEMFNQAQCVHGRPPLVNPHRSDISFSGYPELFLMFAHDAATSEMLGMFSEEGSFCAPSARGRGVTSEMHWLLHESRAKAYSVIDFSIAGWKARVRGHGLILNRLPEQERFALPEDVLADYEVGDGETLVLRERMTPEQWNESWGVWPDEAHIPHEEPSPT